MAARWSVGAGLVVLGLGVLAHRGRAQEQATAAPATPSAHVAPSVAQSGMQVHVDPRTGRFVPEPVVAPPARPLPSPVPQLAEVPASGGGMMVPLNGHFMSNVVATVNPDGTIRMDCVTGDAPVPTDR
jgi:hypothetical protein